MAKYLIKLAYDGKGEKDRNGSIIRVNEFKKAILRKEFQEYLNAGCIYIQDGYSLDKSIKGECTIDPLFTLGKLRSIDLNSLNAIVEFNEKGLKRYNELNQISNPVRLAFSAVTSIDHETKICTNIRILYWTLLPESMCSYNY